MQSLGLFRFTCGPLRQLRFVMLTNPPAVIFFVLIFSLVLCFSMLSLEWLTTEHSYMH